MRKREKIEPGGYYSIGEFILAMHRKLGRTYGWRFAYMTATVTTPGARVVTRNEMIGWQHQSKVPAWAYDQIDQLQLPEPPASVDWSEEEKRYLTTPQSHH